MYFCEWSSANVAKAPLLRICIMTCGDIQQNIRRWIQATFFHPSSPELLKALASTLAAVRHMQKTILHKVYIHRVIQCYTSNRTWRLFTGCIRDRASRTLPQDTSWLVRRLSPLTQSKTCSLNTRHASACTTSRCSRTVPLAVFSQMDGIIIHNIHIDDDHIWISYLDINHCPSGKHLQNPSDLNRSGVSQYVSFDCYKSNSLKGC